MYASVCFKQQTRPLPPTIELRSNTQTTNVRSERRVFRLSITQIVCA